LTRLEIAKKLNDQRRDRGEILLRFICQMDVETEPRSHEVLCHRSALFVVLGYVLSSRLGVARYCGTPSRYLSASSAAMQPEPAAVIACR